MEDLIQLSNPSTVELSFYSFGFAAIALRIICMEAIGEN
jgi:hypothetical protein